MLQIVTRGRSLAEAMAEQRAFAASGKTLTKVATTCSSVAHAPLPLAHAGSSDVAVATRGKA